MQPFPHVYTAAAAARPEGTVALTSPRLPTLVTAPPAEFGGPGDLWSPETLLCAAIADCLVLSFRAIARASKLEWTAIDCRVEGVLQRAEGVSQFTEYTAFVTLEVPAATIADAAQKAIARAEQVCLVSNSLRGKRKLLANVVASAQEIHAT